MNDPIVAILGVALAAVACLVLLWLVPLVSRVKRRLAQAGIDVDEAEDEERALARATGLPPELVAVITAAIAAASGLGTNEFRVVGVNRVEGSGGFNTPVWGHIDRLYPRTNVR